MREMKNSGVAWIGEIPFDWSLIRFKDKFVSKKEVAGEKSSEYERLALTLNGVIKRPKDDSEGLQPKEFDGYQILRENDFVFKMIDLQNISTSRVGLSPYTGLVSPAYIKFSPRTKGQNNKFVYYYLMSLYYNCVYNNLGGNGVRSALNAKDMGEFVIPYPNETVQAQISALLDVKSAHIDTLIANQETQIEKLKQYKQSLITEVVTKGLNPDVEMKDSTINYIDVFPSHWENRKMLSILSMRVIDGPHESPELLDEGVPYISATAIENGKIDFQKMRGYISEEYCNECDKRYKPQINDILVIKLGASTGQVAIVETDMRFNIWVPLAVVRCNEFAVPKFVYYAFQSDYFIKQMEQSWTYGTQQTLGVKTIERLRILLPECKEQQEIVSYLDEQCVKIDKLIEIKQSKIAKLNEYKKSLIYEYVTGKKEV